MEYHLLDLAYGALLHDIGKFYQRSLNSLELTREELSVLPFNNKIHRYTHLHAGLTKRFFNQYLAMDDDLVKIVSEHHKDLKEHNHVIIQLADRIASAIDRQDEEADIEGYNAQGQFITARLHSVLQEVDFGKERSSVVFPLRTLNQMSLPDYDQQELQRDESIEEYKTIFNQFVAEVSKDNSLKGPINRTAFNKMYNLLNQYLVTVPASTYENNRPSVSLFDHLKLTAAIASCLYDQTCFETQKFYMLEIDTSGIQNFIYQVTEGNETKKGLTRALRGRSSLVGIITNAITYGFINAFGLTQANILFNTGGGALILLPYNDEVEGIVNKTSKLMRKELFKRFQTDLTFVDALIELTADELESFQSDKALDLKERLGRHKMQKFYDIIDEDFFYEKIEENHLCQMCGRISSKDICDICKTVDKVSYVYTHQSNFGILYDFDHQYNGRVLSKPIDLGFVTISFVDQLNQVPDHVYVDAMNDFGIGTQKMVANSVPLNFDHNQLSFTEIMDLTPGRYGDRKLAILKMDVDNLGGIFAYGLKKTNEPKTQRSISKYVTMSRLFEYFFGHELVNVCLDVSKAINPNIDRKTSNGTMFYINYAGGDDLVIIGSAYSIIQLSLEIYQRFSQFTGNKNITISGGIHIQNERRAIRFGIQEAEEALEMSKSEDKNAITLIDTRIPFDQYEELLNDVNTMIGLINEGKVSRTMIYNIMSTITDQSYREFVCLIPTIQYVIYRNVGRKKDNKTYEQLISYINNVEATDQGVRKLELIFKLTILFTREEKTHG